MFGDHHIGKILEEVSAIRRALDGIRTELAKANKQLESAEGGRPAWVRSVDASDV